MDAWFGWDGGNTIMLAGNYATGRPPNARLGPLLATARRSVDNFGRIMTETTRETMAIDYAVVGPDAVTVDEVIDLYRDCSLGARRPIDDRAIVASMIQHGNLMVTARDGGRLVGLARTLTDFLYVGYLSDIAVRDAYQRAGIGRELIVRTQAAMGSRSMIVLLAAPAAREYYPHVGFTHIDSAWILRASEPVK